MHRIPGSRDFYALHVGYFVRTWSDDFFDFIGSFPVCSEFSRISFSGVLEDFAKDQISLIKSAIPYVGIVVLCGCVLVILDSDERSISALVNEIEIIQEHGVIAPLVREVIFFEHQRTLFPRESCIPFRTPERKGFLPLPASGWYGGTKGLPRVRRPTCLFWPLSVSSVRREWSY